MRRITWTIPTDLLDASVEVMRPHGRLGNEGLALWLGTAEGGQATVTHLVSLHGDGFCTSPSQLRLSWSAMSRLTDVADERSIYLIGQIHSHSGRLIDLSDVDEKYGVRCQDYLSVVCPHYAQQPVAGLNECGVHIFDDGRYRRLDLREIERRINVTAETVTVIELEVPA